MIRWVIRREDGKYSDGHGWVDDIDFARLFDRPSDAVNAWGSLQAMGRAVGVRAVVVPCGLKYVVVGPGQELP